MKKAGEYKLPPSLKGSTAVGFLLVAMLAMTACSSVEYTPETAPLMIVTNGGAPFFIHGPAQGSGSDRILTGGVEVKVLRREFGYSLVKLADGQQGYVANESLTPSPYATRTPPQVHSTHRRKKPPVESCVIPAFRY